MHRPRDWRRAYKLAVAQNDLRRRDELCEQVRRLIQDRSLELANGDSGSNRSDPAEINELDQALRDLWILQNKDS